MNPDLEMEVRAALAARAATMPAGAGAGLRAVAYRPRTRRFPSHPAVGVAGVAMIGTAVSVAVLGGSQPAFAGWTAAPTRTVNAPSSGAASACEAQLAAMPSPPGSTDDGPWTPVATDVRGPFTLVVYQDGSDFTTCFTGPPFTVVNRRSTGGTATDASGGSASSSGRATGLKGGSQVSQSNASGTGGIEESSVTHLTSAAEGPYTLVEGRIAADVTGITLVTDNGQDVQATTGDGWFLAWWPNSQGVTSARVTTSNGVSTVPLPTSPVTPAAPPAGQSPSGTTPTSGSVGG